MDKTQRAFRAVRVWATKHDAIIDYGFDAANPKQPVIATDWNKVPDKFYAWLDDQEVGLWWLDQCHTCTVCDNLIDLRADVDAESPHFITDPQGEDVCRRCIKKEFSDTELLETILDDYIYTKESVEFDKYDIVSGAILLSKRNRFMLLPSWISPLLVDAGWESWTEDGQVEIYETGLHEHQRDDPSKEFVRIMRVDENLQVVFLAYSRSQFTLQWHILVKPI